MSKLSQFLKDGDGQFSSMRLVFLLWGLGALVMWVIASWHAKTLAVVPDSVIAMTGVTTTGKIIQSFSENNSTPQPSK